MPAFSETHVTDALLKWFDAQKRDLPWRDAPCGQRDGYRVWLAEIMLQQTTVAAVKPYYQTFLEKWPDVKALARADDDDVMRAWAGLGYYARARNMVKCAREVADERQGAFPRDVEGLLSLPGIGPYTAAAIAAIAFNTDVAPVDGNVIRTLTRLYAIDQEMPKHKDLVGARAEALLPKGRGKGRAGDFAEALMDLGATVCRPKNPDCSTCPWAEVCQARAAGEVLAYPKKAPKKAKPTRKGWALWVERPDGHVLLEKRADKGLLGGMMGLPTTDWTDQAGTPQDAVEPLAPLDWAVAAGEVRHTFTHFHLELGVIRAQVGAGAELPGIWVAPAEVDAQALPSVMKKAVRHARGASNAGQ